VSSSHAEVDGESSFRAQVRPSDLPPEFIFRRQMAHHWIRDDDQFTATEKWVMTVIESWQFNGHMTGVSQAVIARGCSLSVRAVQKAIQSIERKGYPIVARRSSKGDATHYLVKQRQKLMFSRSNSPDLGDVRSRPGTQTSGARPVQNLVQNHPNAERLASLRHPPYEPRSPESPPHTNDVRTLSEESSETTNSKPRAELRPDSAHFSQATKSKAAKQRIAEHADFRKSEDDRRKVEARQRRLGRIASATIETMPVAPRLNEQQLAERLSSLRDQERKLGVA
jgi:biotin operon repressor